MAKNKQIDKILRLIMEATAPVTGEAFFRTLVQRLATALAVRYAFITESLDDPPTRVRMLAYWAEDDFAEPREFELAETPCEAVFKKGRVCYYPRELDKHFPKDKRLINLKSYVGVPIYDISGSKIIGHIALFDDKELDDEPLIESITKVFAARAGAELQRTQVERALRESEEKYRLLVENQTDLVVRLDDEGRVTFVSPSYCETFGQTERALLGQPCVPLIGTPKQPTEALARLLKPPHRCHVDRQAMTVHGWRWIAWAAKAMLDKSGKVIEIVADGRDVTEQKRAEEQARRHLSELAHVLRLSSMGEMASAIAHELNQPLTAILSCGQAGLRRLASPSLEKRDLRSSFELVVKNAKRAGSIVRRVRDFIRKDEPHWTTVDVNYLVRDVLSLMDAEIRQSDIALTVELGRGLHSVRVDVVQIQQVLINIVRNAIEAMNAGASRRRKIAIRTAQEQHRAVTITIADTGPGIPKEIAERLFEPFVTSKAHGMGLGLSISRSIVEVHGGQLRATSVADGGTTFKIILPDAENGEDDQ